MPISSVEEVGKKYLWQKIGHFDSRKNIKDIQFLTSLCGFKKLNIFKIKVLIGRYKYLSLRTIEKVKKSIFWMP